MEDKLGVRLFRRTSKGVIITKEGEVLFGYVSEVFGLINRAEQAVSDLKNFEKGQVVLGGSDSTFKHFLLPYIQTFQHSYPDIKIKIQLGSTPQILDKLVNGHIDIGIVHLPIDQSRLHVTDFRSIESIFVAGGKYRYLADKKLTVKELINHPIISFSESSSSRQFLNQVLQEKNLSVTPDIEVGSVELLIEFAKNGMGIAFATKELISKELMKGELHEIAVDFPIKNRKIGIATRKEVPLSIAANQFYEQLIINSLK